MKYCEDCGTQLEDDATFCTNCGAKQEIVFIPEVESPVNQLNENQDRILIIEQEPKLKEIKLSDVCTPEKREIKSWLLLILLVLFSPLILCNIIGFLPSFLFWVAYICLQLWIIMKLWRKRNWYAFIKVIITMAYVVMFIIYLKRD